MTRRDFQLIADVLADAESEQEENPFALAAIYRVADRFADRLASTNPRFDSGRFLHAACPLRRLPVK